MQPYPSVCMRACICSRNPEILNKACSGHLEAHAVQAGSAGGCTGWPGSEACCAAPSAYGGTILKRMCRAAPWVCAALQHPVRKAARSSNACAVLHPGCVLRCGAQCVRRHNPQTHVLCCTLGVCCTAAPGVHPYLSFPWPRVAPSCPCKHINMRGTSLSAHTSAWPPPAHATASCPCKHIDTRGTSLSAHTSAWPPH